MIGRRILENYLVDNQRITSIAEIFGIPFELAKDAIKEVGLDYEKLLEYLRRRISLKNDGLYFCKRCKKPLKSVQSILDGYGSTCLEKLKNTKEFYKNNLVRGSYNETNKTATNSGIR